jgi:penicillin G amidase
MIIRRALALLILPLALSLFAPIARGAQPPTASPQQARPGITVPIPGEAPVEIVRDRWGVPQIRAASERGTYFGLGYAHAQDRLWQMEFQRRAASGRLAEILGQGVLPSDAFLRTVGLRRAAEEAWSRLEPEARRPIEAYAAGVNAFVASQSDAQLPPEFGILKIKPAPWTPVDSLLILKLVSWSLAVGGNWQDELLRVRLAAQLGPERAAQLMPVASTDDPLVVPQDGQAAPAARSSGAGAPAEPPVLASVAPSAYTELFAVDRMLQQSLGIGRAANGSNAWVIDGRRSTTGKPILANDPHLGTQAPAFWYLAALRGGQLHAIGATIPGLPAIVIGRNQHIAWGITNSMVDTQDLYVEQVDLVHNTAAYQGVQEPMRVISETLSVKDAAPLTLTVRVTRHGPLIADGTKPGEQPLALRWVGHDAEDRTIESLMRMAKAQDWARFREALKLFKAPMQNVHFASVAGDIAYMMPGALPIRARGDGNQPAPGWTGSHEWTRYAPFEELPQSLNPPQGYLASANNQIAPASYPYRLSNGYSPAYRALRIAELIEDEDKLSVEDMQRMQADQYSVQARELLPYLHEIAPTTQLQHEALRLLKRWDGKMSARSPQAAIFQAWYRALPRRIFADELGPQLWDSYRRETNFIAILLPELLKGQGGPWCDDLSTPGRDDCQAIVAAAFDDGLQEMARLQGSQRPAEWRWDHVHQMRFPHRPFDGNPQLQPTFSRSIPFGGDDVTLNVAPPEDDSYNSSHAAQYRQLVDLSEIEASRFMVSLGQSGLPSSEHYDDLLERWRRVKYLPMRLERGHEGAAESELEP